MSNNSKEIFKNKICKLFIKQQHTYYIVRKHKSLCYSTSFRNVFNWKATTVTSENILLLTQELGVRRKMKLHYNYYKKWPHTLLTPFSNPPPHYTADPPLIILTLPHTHNYTTSHFNRPALYILHTWI